MPDDGRQQVTFTSGQTGPDGPLEDGDQQGAGDQSAPESRPEVLPENFDSVESLVKSYKELQARLSKGQQSQDNSDDTTQQTDDGDQTNQETQQSDEEGDEQGEEQQEEQQTQQLPEQLQPFADEFSEKGELSEDSYNQLAELGYAKEVVDAYIAGVTGNTAGEALTEDDAKAIKDAVGGEEQFASLQQWAGENLTDDEMEAYNGAIQNKATAKMAVEWLQMKHQSAEGFEPEQQVEAKPSTTPTAKPFRSAQELSKAMQDPRYKEGDPAYHAEVERRLAVSNI